MAKCKCVGIEIGTYVKKSTGELKEKQIMHVIWEDKTQNDLVGQMVENVFIPSKISINHVRLGGLYKFNYSANGRYAVLEGIEEIES